MKCILIHNDLKNFRAEPISIKKFNRNFVSYKNDTGIDYILMPVSQFSESYISIPTVALPNNFNPITIKYTLVVYELTRDFASIINTHEQVPNSEVMVKDFSIECKTLSELYVFIFSIIKLMAYNEIQNTCRFKNVGNTVYAFPLSTSYIYTFDAKNFVFDISDMTISSHSTEIDSLHGNHGLMTAVQFVQKIFGTSIEPNRLIIPNIYKFYVDKNGKCRYTPFNNIKKLVGNIDFSKDHLMSCACNHYNAYYFISSADKIILDTLFDGKVRYIMYSLMSDEDDIELDGPLDIDTIISNPMYGAIHKLEEYPLYTTSDYIEVVAFAGEMLSMMNVVSELVGDEYSDCKCMMEITSSTPYGTFCYDILWDQIESGEIPDVVDDFIEAVCNHSKK